MRLLFTDLVTYGPYTYNQSKSNHKTTTLGKNEAIHTIKLHAQQNIMQKLHIQ